MLSTGQLLAERYRLASRIAVGGMGEVWEASDTRLDRTVAVKVLKAELSGDAEFLHRFRTEARTTASLNHHGIAGVHDYGETADPDTDDGSGQPQHVAYLVMELVQGEPLAGILAQHGRISAERTLDILEQAGHALQAAHERGLVHRDVKPGNILVTATGQVKITDFGVAKAADAAPVTRSGMVMGTAHYIAPEQALGHDAEPASDVYSLAVCGYECLSGYRPFRSENAVTVAMMHIRDLPPPLPPDVPPGPRALIEATLVKDPRQRYRSGGEFAAAVAAVRAGHPLPPPMGLAATQPYPGPAQPIPQVGPGSHPAMHPVAAPATTQPPPDRGARTALWVTLAVVIVLLVLGAVLLLPKLLDSPTSGRPGPGESGGLDMTEGRQPDRTSQSAVPPPGPTGLGSPRDSPVRPTDESGSHGPSSTGQGDISQRNGSGSGSERGNWYAPGERAPDAGP